MLQNYVWRLWMPGESCVFVGWQIIKMSLSTSSSTIFYVITKTFMLTNVTSVLSSNSYDLTWKSLNCKWNILKNMNSQFKAWRNFLHEDYLSKTKEFHINIQQIYEEQNVGYVKKQCKVVLCILNSPSSVQSKHFCFWKR